MSRKLEMFVYLAVILLQTVILKTKKENYPNTFGVEFVTLFPWSKKASNATYLTFEIINASENDTAIVSIEYDIGLGNLEDMIELPKDVLNVKPNSYITHKFDVTTIMTRPSKGSKSIIPVGASRIFISSSLPVSIVECIFITDKIGDCFTVIPITMAGNHYSFSTASPIFSVYISTSSPILVLLTMRTRLTEISNENFACTMLMPLPHKAYSEIALRDDFDVHFAPLQSSNDYQTQLLLSAPMQSYQPFTVATFRPYITRLINVKPNNISNDNAIKWDYHFNDAILYDVPHQSKNTLLLDGEAIDAEYMQNFENPFRYITLRKINSKKLKRGLHCLESKGRYLLFIYGGSEKNYGYAYAFNAYPEEMLKSMVRNNPSLYRQDIFGVSFITLFPWMTKDNANDDDFTTALTLDILNPDPYMIAIVKICYRNELSENLTEVIYDIKPYTHQKLKMNKTMMTKLRDAHGDGIHESVYDSRITITSSIPISVTQNCFFHDRIGDSFAVLPLKMSDQKYSFSIPKSVANNSHAIIYFLPSNQTTKISIIAKAKENSSIFAYYGSGDELSMNLWGDNSFQVIIALQRLQIIPATLDNKRRIDFGCTMAVPAPQNAQYYNYSGFFTMTPSDRKCPSYYADLFPRKGSIIKKQKRLTFEPAIMQHYFQLSAAIFSDFSTIHCRNDYIQIYAFGASNLEGNYIDFIPSTQQYVTGRTHFAAYHYQNWVLIFMDKYAINDIEMDGKFIADNYIYEMSSPNNSGYFALQAVHSTVRLHYVQSTGYYAVHILSDTLKNAIPSMTKKSKQKLYANTTVREISTKRQKLKLFTKSVTTACSKNLSACKSFTIGGRNSNVMILDRQPLADANG
ncbi:unnamed protein product [Acanthocheilonema viteae]|uniref:IgGFc-binding protein N-terminal domain-containing protein n=1 Tax=Acanthocheilonema viteae TaxID=6277 RepID=A0A498SLT8_ACAVI|nr:unnamed protein product [Acanthocheilonema viteae]